MNVNWLADFLSLAETGNFTRSAARRHTTQSAFSRRIQALEEWAGAPLFHRGIQPVTLTAAGEAFEPVAREVLVTLEQARYTLRQAFIENATVVRFSITHSVAFHFFPTWFHGIEQQAAGMTTHLICQSSTDCIGSLSRGDSHYTMFHYHPRLDIPLNSDAIRTCLAGTDRLVPVSAAGPAGPLFDIRNAEDAAKRYLAYSNDSGLSRIVSYALKELRIGLGPPAFTSEHASILKSMALEGYGFAWLPMIDIKDEISSGKLLRAGDASFDIELDIRIFRGIQPLPPAAEDLWTIMCAHSVQ